MKRTQPHKRIPQGASIDSHRHAWNFIAKEYVGGTALPAWGCRGELKDQKALVEIKNKKILEIGSGSGDSIIYLIKQGAKKVTGLDFSPTQINLAKDRIQKAFKANANLIRKANLLLQSMDGPLPQEQFDAVIAIYSIGWSEHPEKLFKKVYNRLLTNGYFYFSWDHYISRIAEQNEKGVAIVKSYHEPMPLVREDWKGSGSLIETHQLRPSDWFQMLVNAGFVVDGFWEPKPDKQTSAPRIYSENYSPTISEMIPTCVVFRAKRVE